MKSELEMNSSSLCNLCKSKFIGKINYILAITYIPVKSGFTLEIN